MANGAFHTIHAAEAGVFELRDFAAAGNGGSATRNKRLVDHALDDDRTGRVIRARFGTQPEEFYAGWIHIVLIDQADDRICGHRVDAVVGSTNAETAPHNLANLRPLVIRPVTPILEPYAVWRDVGGEAADSDGSSVVGLIHGESSVSPAILVW